MTRAKIILALLLVVATMPACGLLDWVRSLGEPDIECPEGMDGPHTLELMMVNDEMSCSFLESERGDLGRDGPVWIEVEPFGIQAYGGHPCHLASHDRQELATAVDGLVAADDHFLIALGEDYSVDGRSTWKAYLLEKPALITGEQVEKAYVRFDDQTSAPVVMVHLTETGAATFERLTEINLARRLAIVVDGEVVSAPRIQEKIPGGKIQITQGMYGSHDELYCKAKALADSLGDE